MSCVLRVFTPDIEVVLERLSISPFRVEDGVAHFDVSDAPFNDFNAQIDDAIAFLRTRRTEVIQLMSTKSASGELDFAIEWRDVLCQFDTFPSALVGLAGALGLGLTLSHYPVATEDIIPA